jgi:hypothetical protein
MRPQAGAGKLICAPICLQWFMRANWRRFGGTFLFNPAAPEIPLKHAPPTQADDLPVVAQAVSTAYRILSHLLTVAAPI